jgi:hypothetical protein
MTYRAVTETTVDVSCGSGFCNDFRPRRSTIGYGDEETKEPVALLVIPSLAQAVVG